MQPSRAYFRETFLGIRTGCRNVIYIPTCILGASYFITKYREYSPSADFTAVRYEKFATMRNCLKILRSSEFYTALAMRIFFKFPHSSEFYTAL